jgi:hypothetical protein
MFLARLAYFSVFRVSIKSLLKYAGLPHTVGAQSITCAQSIALRHSTYVIMPKKPTFRKFLFGKIKKEEFARRFFKKTVYF